MGKVLRRVGVLRLRRRKKRDASAQDDTRLFFIALGGPMAHGCSGSLRISAAGSRFAHARKTPDPSARSARSGFRLRAPASLTPARRLNLTVRYKTTHQSPASNRRIKGEV